MSFGLTERILANFKARYGVNHTGLSNVEWFAELFEVRPPVYGSEAWLELTPGVNFYANHDAGVMLNADIRRTRTWNGSSWVSVASGDVIPVEHIIAPLAQLTATNQQGYMSLATPQGSVDPPDVTAANRLRDYIRFSDFGTDFLPRIYWDNGSGTGVGAEITTLALPNGWAWDADAGILLLGADTNGEFVPVGNLPIWISHYRYVGIKGAGTTFKHNDLSGIQGGVGGEYYHLSEQEHIDLLTPDNHRQLDQLVHELDESHYMETAYSGSMVTAIDVWTDSGKTTKIRDWVYTYTGIKVTTIVNRQYGSGGLLVETLTYTLTYTANRVANVSCIRS